MPQWLPDGYVVLCKSPVDSIFSLGICETAPYAGLWEGKEEVPPWVGWLSGVEERAAN